MSEAELGLFKLSDFTIFEYTAVRFKVTKPSYLNFTQKDVDEVKGLIEKSMGKWETIVKTSKQFFAELGLITTKENISKFFGVELYDIRANFDSNYNCGWFFISLKDVEERKRKHDKLDPIISVDEIYNQIANIPKWQSFEKTLEILKEKWSGKESQLLGFTT